MPRRLARALVVPVVLAGCAAPGPDPGPEPGPRFSGACSDAARTHEWRAPRVTRAGGSATFAAMIEHLAGERAILVGEIHDRFDHHLTQLEIACRLTARGVRVVLGFEAFQQPAQSALDAYALGRIDLAALLRRTGYFERWGFDFRHYAPLLAFARDRGLALVALNAPSETVRAARRGGYAAVAGDERVGLPTRLPRAGEAYRERLRAAYEAHPPAARPDFERFVDSQQIWDESMAAAASRTLRDAPDATLVVIAGNGHAAWRDALGDRIERRTTVRPTIVAQAPVGDAAGTGAEGAYLLEAEPIALAPPGRLGVRMRSAASGVEIAEVTAGGAAHAAGLEAGDRILVLDGHPVASMADVRAGLWDRVPGARVEIEVRRRSADHRYAVTLR